MKSYVEPQYCPSCDEKIMSDELYEIDGLFVCENCFREWLIYYAKTNASDIAAALNIAVISTSNNT